MKTMNQNRFSKNQETAMHCTVCKSHGFPESVWKSHNVRKTSHPESMVTCPTILNNKCSYCKQNGHFVSRCPIKKIEEKEMKRLVYEERVEVVKATKPNVVMISKHPKNKFAVLMEDSESESEEPVVYKKRDYKSISWTDMNESDSDED